MHILYIYIYLSRFEELIEHQESQNKLLTQEIRGYIQNIIQLQRVSDYMKARSSNNLRTLKEKFSFYELISLDLKSYAFRTVIAQEKIREIGSYGTHLSKIQAYIYNIAIYKYI